MLTAPGFSKTAPVRQIAVPQAARRLSSLGRIDYADAFLVDIGPGGHATAEQWAREVLDGAPALRRGSLLAGWSAIGLKLDVAASRGRILGWEIRRSTSKCVVLGAESRLGMPAELLFKRESGALLFSTFVRQDNALVRAMWAGVEPVHVPVVRDILEQASRRI